MYLLRLEDSRGRGFDIVGSSPEALVTVKDGVAVTHPIAGSKARGGTPAEDAALEAELLSDPKERRAFDAGGSRAQRPWAGLQTGTVEVVEFMDVRRYSHIMHLESTVQGRVDADHSALDVVLNAFLPAPCRAPRSAPWRSSTSSRFLDGLSTVEWSVIWTSPVTRTPRSPSAPLCCAMGWLTFRPVAGSSPTPTRRPRTRSPRTRPPPWSVRSRWPRPSRPLASTR